MWTIWLTPILLILPSHNVLGLFPGAVPDDGDVRHIYPMLHIGLGLDEHAHALPYIFGWLENIDWPKDRIRLEVYLNSKEDSTPHQVTWWLDSTRQYFKDVKVIDDAENWLESALRNARLAKAGRCLLLSGDTVPTEYRMVQYLFADSSHTVVSALFRSIDGGVNIEGASDELVGRKYVREEIFTFALPMAINLTSMDSSYLTFDANNLPFYEGANDPSQVFTESAQKMDISLWADNQVDYGYYVNGELEVEERRNLFRYQLADVLADEAKLPYVSRSVRPWTPEAELWDVDKIYLINLKRRPERLERMKKILALLGIDYVVWEATDGQKLESLPEPYKSYKVLDGYVDPIAKRPMKLGEIGCFLSHYRIWEDVVKNNYEKVIVFEDDLRFAPDGMQRVRDVLQDLHASKKPWDLIYLGRKKQSKKEELWVYQHRHLSTVEYSYWTLGYLLSASGAQKLLAPDPLKNVVPVDEYLPIMFNKHPDENWSSNFEPHNLDAFTLFPLVVFPQRYTNEPGYVSDTEDSTMITEAAHEATRVTEKDEL